MRFNRYNLIEAVKNNDINKINYILKAERLILILKTIMEKPL